MKTLLLGVLIALGVSTPVLAQTVQRTEAENLYVEWIYDYWASGDTDSLMLFSSNPEREQQMVNTGRAICAAKARGLSGDVVRESVLPDESSFRSGLEYSRERSRVVVMLISAYQNLCPD